MSYNQEQLSEKSNKSNTPNEPEMISLPCSDYTFWRGIHILLYYILYYSKEKEQYK